MKLLLQQRMGLGRWCLLVVLMLGPLQPWAVSEEAAEQRQYQDTKTRQRQAVGQACANRLEPLQAALQGDSAPSRVQLSELIEQLGGLLDRPCSSSYEKSQIYNLLGYSHYSLEQYPRAIDSYLKMLAEPEVDDRQKVATRYTVAQLYFIQEDYGRAARQLETWLTEAPEPGSDGRMLLAQAYYYLKRQDESLRLVNQIVAEALSSGKIPKESWWSLQRVLFYERGEYQKVIAVLKRLVTHYPSTRYWQQLGGIFGQLERSGDQLAMMDLLHLQRQLKDQRQLLSLAYLYLGAEVPFRAASILDEGMSSGVIEPTAKNLETLGSAWQLARETDKALPVLQRAANLSDSGAIASRLASAYLDANDNSAAVREARNALRKGDLSRPALTRLTLGAALVNLNCYREAEPVFEAAAADQNVRKTARQWLQYVRSEAVRREKLMEMDADITGCQSI